MGLFARPHPSLLIKPSDGVRFVLIEFGPKVPMRSKNFLKSTKKVELSNIRVLQTPLPWPKEDRAPSP